MTASTKLVIVIDENKLKEWIQMCYDLEAIPPKWRKQFAVDCKMRELEEENRKLLDENQRYRSILNPELWNDEGE
jgi:hypothetical protein